MDDVQIHTWTGYAVTNNRTFNEEVRMSDVASRACCSASPTYLLDLQRPPLGTRRISTTFLSASHSHPT
ncbi:hypothetical protein MRX96_007218 [Rhipicephalus microplus]